MAKPFSFLVGVNVDVKCVYVFRIIGNIVFIPVSNISVLTLRLQGGVVEARSLGFFILTAGAEIVFYTANVLCCDGDLSAA